MDTKKKEAKAGDLTCHKGHESKSADALFHNEDGKPLCPVCVAAFLAGACPVAEPAEPKAPEFAAGGLHGSVLPTLPPTVQAVKVDHGHRSHDA